MHYFSLFATLQTDYEQNTGEIRGKVEHQAKKKMFQKSPTGSAFPFPKLGSSETFTGDPLVYGPLDKWGLRSFLGNPHKSVLAEHNL